ncbi:hypothetical protein PGT21_000182 [Puccinia graminis f. sp. tritici]|uniref:Uncharacterized protein n=1 Tax=Puccinia graminis f. sp. tritici TaxID=56615 RepID=A0A5B0MFN5_PUCGR|nr:hypothetical protein PGT21_000182 [Puccinia graminis f. sp. tritici]
MPQDYATRPLSRPISTSTSPANLTLKHTSASFGKANTRLTTQPTPSFYHPLDHSNQTHRTTTRPSEPKQYHRLTSAPSSIKPPHPTRPENQNRMHPSEADHPIRLDDEEEGAEDYQVRARVEEEEGEEDEEKESDQELYVVTDDGRKKTLSAESHEEAFRQSIELVPQIIATLHKRNTTSNNRSPLTQLEEIEPIPSRTRSILPILTHSKIRNWFMRQTGLCSVEMGTPAKLLLKLKKVHAPDHSPELVDYDALTLDRELSLKIKQTQEHLEASLKALKDLLIKTGSIGSGGNERSLSVNSSFTRPELNDRNHTQPQTQPTHQNRPIGSSQSSVITNASQMKSKPRVKLTQPATTISYLSSSTAAICHQRSPSRPNSNPK